MEPDGHLTSCCCLLLPSLAFHAGCLAQRKLLQPAAENQGLAGAVQDAFQNTGIPALTQQVQGLTGGNSVPLTGGAAGGDTPPTGRGGGVLEGLRDQILGVQQQVQNAGLQAQNAGTQAGDVLGEFGRFLQQQVMLCGGNACIL